MKNPNYRFSRDVALMNLHLMQWKYLKLPSSLSRMGPKPKTRMLILLVFFNTKSHKRQNTRTRRQIFFSNSVRKHDLDHVRHGHYANTPMQYTAIFHGCKNVHFQDEIFKYFSYFCSKH